MCLHSMYRITSSETSSLPPQDESKTHKLQKSAGTSMHHVAIDVGAGALEKGHLPQKAGDIVLQHVTQIIDVRNSLKDDLSLQFKG